MKIRALGMMETIGEALSVYKRAFGPLFLLSLILAIPGALLNAWTKFQFSELQEAFEPMLKGGRGFKWLLVPEGLHALTLLGKGLLVGALFALLISFIGLIVQGAIVKVGVNALDECDTSVSQALKLTLSRSKDLFSLSVLMALGLFAGYLCFFIPGVWLTLAWLFSLTVLMIEETNAPEAMKRSWHLSKGRKWRMFGILIVLLLGIGLASALASGLLGISALTGFNFGAELGGQLINALVTPLGPLVYLLMYFDARVRDENYSSESSASEMMTQGVEHV